MRRSKRLVLVVAVLIVGALGFTVLFVPPPRPLLRWMIVSASPTLLEGPAPEESRIVRTSKKLLRVYVNVSVAYYLAERARAKGGTDDVILGRMMAEVREMVLNPRSPVEIRHSTAVWPALISGIGYCDQLNAIVCRMGAHHFEKAQLIALYLPDGHFSPHTIGRVWSKQRGEWLYFDAFYAEPVIFTRNASGKPHFLSTYAGDVMHSRESMTPNIYELQGWKLSDFPSTFGMYILNRASADDSVTAVPVRIAPGSPRPESGGIMAEQPTELVQPVAWEPPIDRVPLRQPEVFRSVTHAYAVARVSHLLGRPDRNAYRAVVQQTRAAQRDDRAAEIVSAATRFAHLSN